MELTIAKASTWNLWGKTKKNHGKLQSGKSIKQSRFKSDTSQTNLQLYHQKYPSSMMLMFL
jgi:hypothetical protein